MLVVEDSKVNDLVGQRVGVGLGVALAHTHEQQEPVLDRADGLAVNSDRGGGDTLE